MNNLTFGDARYQYYETICSGAPAGPGFDGASAVHTHMTNSRLTDPEVLESRFPVVLEDFHIRRGSGGKGRWNAGDGTLRRIRFREPMELALLTDRRRVRSFGMEGGEPGELGRNIVRRNDGRREELPGCAQTVLEAGEAIEIVTPTGGGWGKKGDPFSREQEKGPRSPPPSRVADARLTGTAPAPLRGRRRGTRRCPLQAAQSRGWRSRSRPLR